MRVCVLADDLTGALDAGAEFARVTAGMRVVWHGGTVPAAAESLAIDSGTREAAADTARAAVERLAPTLAAGEIAFKKIDSLIRGATVAEIAACFGSGLWGAAILAPAFPYQGRVTRGGQQWARAGAGWAPVGPALVAALRAEGVPAQMGRIGGALAAGISVFDAETDLDLDMIAAMGSPGALWIGTGGLARAVAGSMGAVADDGVSGGLALPILGLFGSDQAATLAQLAYCAPHWHQLEGRVVAEAVMRGFAGGLALVSVALPEGLGREEAGLRIGDALAGLARASPRPGTLLVAGGETLRGLCVALGARSLTLAGRIVPGVARAVLCGGVWDGVTVVSKSGAFGPPSLLRDLLAGNGFVFDEGSV